MKIIKNLRKTINSKVLVVSDDDALKEVFVNELDRYLAKADIVSNKKELLGVLAECNYDIIVVDTEIQDFEFDTLCRLINEISLCTPKIVVSGSFTDDLILDAINMNAYTLLSKPLNLKDFKLSLLMSLNQTRRGDKVEFDDGFYYDEYREQFFNSRNKIVELTKLEYGLLRLLLDKRGEITDYDTIQKEVWKEKKMSIYTMRNVVNKIRQKMYYDIVKNHSNKGYTIGEVKN